MLFGILCAPIAGILLVSCVSSDSLPADFSDRNDRVSIPDLPRFFPEYSKHRTKQEGVSDARRHAREVGFRIIRYDLPIVRAGNWGPHFRRFKHFGVSEGFLLSATLGYCRAYNAEMDRLLQRRYGDEYRKYRKKLLPPPDSEPFIEPFVMGKGLKQAE